MSGSFNWPPKGSSSGSANAPHNTNILDMTGNNGVVVLDVANRTMIDVAQLRSLNWQARITYDALDRDSIDYGNRALLQPDITGPATSVDWGGFRLIGSDLNLAASWDLKTLNTGASVVSVSWGDRLLYDLGGTQKALDWLNRVLVDNANNETLDWQTGLLVSGGITSVNWTSRLLADSGNVNSVDWQNRTLVDGGTTISIDYASRLARDSAGNQALSYQSRYLNDGDTAISVDWNARQLLNASALAVVNWSTYQTADSSGGTSIDWNDRQLFATGGHVSVDWLNHQLANNDGTIVLDWSNQQGAGGVTTAGFTQNTSLNIAYAESTFQGGSASGAAYTISDIVTALKAYGLLTP